MNRFDSDNFELRNTGVPHLNPDFRSSYLMNSKITGVEEADLLILVGTNPKIESPLLNSRILKATKKNKLKVFFIYFFLFNNFNYNNNSNINIYNF